MSSLKLEPIPILDGVSNYADWTDAIRSTLQGEGLWGHVGGDDDPLSPWPRIPCPVIGENFTRPQGLAFREWWQSDAKACNIIKRRLSPTVRSLLLQDDKTKAITYWEKLRDLFGRVDAYAEFELRERITSLKLRDSLDVDRYLGKFNVARSKFLTMGVAFSEGECVYTIIRGLPTSGNWPAFKQHMSLLSQNFHNRERGVAEEDRAPSNTLFDKIVQCISSECHRLNVDKPTKGPGPGLEYVTAASEIQRHGKNPQGIPCSNCRKLSHDREHCWAKGGGMEGQGPSSNARPKSRNTTFESPAAALASDGLVVFSSTSATFATTASAKMSSHPTSHPTDDLSFASMDHMASLPDSNLALIAQHAFAAVLDSGTTSHLIRDWHFFSSYDTTWA